MYCLIHARIQEFSSGGVQVSLTKKSSDVVVFLFIFLVLSLFYRSQMVNLKEIYHFSRFQRGSNIFQGGPTFSRGVQLLIPYRNPYNLWISRGGGGSGPPAPPPPLDPHLLLKTLNICFCWEINKKSWYTLLTLKAPPIIFSRRQLQILPLF